MDRVAAFCRGEVPDQPLETDADVRRTRRAREAAEGGSPQPKGGTGICCSGGGIRSAAYNLGALQVLQDEQELQHARYLAAVSGGSYIAAALWIVQRGAGDAVFRRDGARSASGETGGDRSGERSKAAQASDGEAGGKGGQPARGFCGPPFAHLSPEERYLRSNTAYLAPGFKGKLRLMSNVLLGLTLNLLLVVGLLYLAASLFAVVAIFVRPDLTTSGAVAPMVITSAGRELLLRVLAGMAVASLAFALYTTSRHVAEGRQAVLLRTAKGLGGAAAIGFAACFAFPWLLATARELLSGTAVAEAAAPPGEAADGSGGLGLLLGLTAALGLPPVVQGVVRSWLERLDRGGSKLLERLRARLTTPEKAATIATPVVLVAVSAFCYNVAASVGWQPLQWQLAAGAAAILVLLYLVFDPTASSMYPFYKRRLCTAFALRRDGDSACERPYDDLIPLSQTRIPGWPELIICAAANVSDPGATPTGRNAVPFTFSAGCIGGPDVGYVDTATYERLLGPKRQHDITLPAAVAMSGAALSPSMGKMTKPSATFLLALANARLGVWLPNPAYVNTLDGDRPGGKLNRWLQRRLPGRALPAARRNELVQNWPRPRMTWLLREMRGLNSVNGRYLYVSDGGHYENLGLLELLRRGCTTIYCFDASGDPEGSYATIGQAIALARSELAVEIDLDPKELRRLDTETNLYSANSSTIPFTYADGTEGRILYVKCSLTPTDPWDLIALRARDQQFPNHSTSEQHYGYERFEAYRALGACTTKAALEQFRAATGQPDDLRVETNGHAPQPDSSLWV